MILGLLTVVAGVVSLFRPGASILLLAGRCGRWLVADGLVWVARAVATEGPAAIRVWFVVAGLLSIIAAIVVLAFPGGSLVLLTRFGGFMLLVIGIVSIGMVTIGNRMGATTSTSRAGGSAI